MECQPLTGITNGLNKRFGADINNRFDAKATKREVLFLLLGPHCGVQEPPFATVP